MKTSGSYAFAVALLLLTSMASKAVEAQTQNFTVIAPFAPGGSSDVLMRAAAKEIGERLNDNVIVDNKAGAGGTIGLAAVARATPDGKTLGLGGVGSLVYSAGIYDGRLQFDARKDLVPVSLLGTTPVVVVVPSSLNIADLKSLTDYAKAQGKELAYSSAGIGSATHLAGELFTRKTGIKLRHVPYKGLAPALTAVLSGEVAVGFLDAATVMGQLDNKALRVIAVAAKDRIPQMKDVPTTAEGGVADLVVQIWYGIVAPAQTPADALKRVEHAAGAATRSPAFSETIIRAGYAAMPGGRAEFQKLLDTEFELWLPIIKDAGIKAD